MGELVEVAILVEADVAAALANPHARAAAGRVISRLVHRQDADDPLLKAMDRFAEEARRTGLTQEVVDEELAAYNAERREADDPLG